VRTYAAGGDARSGAELDPDGREWVFGLLDKPRYRNRIQLLEQLDLRRRDGCESSLRALVTGT
jgi:hypothetical protein